MPALFQPRTNAGNRVPVLQSSLLHGLVRACLLLALLFALVPAASASPATASCRVAPNDRVADEVHPVPADGWEACLPGESEPGDALAAAENRNSARFFCAFVARGESQATPRPCVAYRGQAPPRA